MIRATNQVRKENLFPQTILEKNIVDKVPGLTEKGFSVKCFTANILQFGSAAVTNFIFGGQLGSYL